MKTIPYILPLCLILGLGTGCLSVSPETVAGLTNFNHKPPESIGELRVPDQMTERHYVLSRASQTMSIPVAFAMHDAGTPFSVMRENSFGYAENVGTFQGAKLIEKTFRKIVEDNFHLAHGDEVPAALFSVKVAGISLRESAWSDVLEAKLRLQVDLTKEDGPGLAFSKVFFSTCKLPWPDKGAVPPAFFEALDKIVGDFLAEWESSGAVAFLLKWNGEANPGVLPPELTAIEWTKEGDKVWLGHCEVDCNGYEGFAAKAWANAQIAAACRTKLGINEQERVRVLYDGETFDSQAKKWTFRFRTFVRSKIVLSFNKVTRHGLVTGDIELMNVKANDLKAVEAAAKELENFVISQMGSHVGVVSQDAKQAEAWVRFDDFKTDGTYNLITITFRLVN